MRLVMPERRLEAIIIFSRLNSNAHRGETQVKELPRDGELSLPLVICDVSSLDARKVA